MEIWKDVTGFENQYQISNIGKVRSKPRILTRSNGSKQTVKGRILKTFVGSTGYEFAVFQVGKKTKNFAVHRLVAIHFLNNDQNKYAVNHLNGIKTDNNVQNLEWVTKSENEIHARKNGLKCTKGEKASKAVLNTNQILEIRNLRGKMTGREVAKIYGVTHSAIFAIWTNRTWSHV